MVDLLYFTKLIAEYDKPSFIEPLQYTEKKRHKNWKGYGEISLTFWNVAVEGARSKNRSREIKFDITIQEGWKKFIQQGGICCLTGLNLCFGFRFGKDRENITSSLDRINSNLDYTNENCQWVHKVVNMMKNNLTDESFKDWCKLIYHYIKVL